MQYSLILHYFVEVNKSLCKSIDYFIPTQATLNPAVDNKVISKMNVVFERKNDNHVKNEFVLLYL